jgi:hypothetical protein
MIYSMHFAILCSHDLVHLHCHVSYALIDCGHASGIFFVDALITEKRKPFSFT